MVIAVVEWANKEMGRRKRERDLLSVRWRVLERRRKGDAGRTQGESKGGGPS